MTSIKVAIGPTGFKLVRGNDSDNRVHIDADGAESGFTLAQDGDVWDLFLTPTSFVPRDRPSGSSGISINVKGGVTGSVMAAGGDIIGGVPRGDRYGGLPSLITIAVPADVDTLILPEENKSEEIDVQVPLARLEHSTRAKSSVVIFAKIITYLRVVHRGTAQVLIRAEGGDKAELYKLGSGPLVLRGTFGHVEGDGDYTV